MFIPSGDILICDICGHKGAHIRRVTRKYGEGNKLVVIENAPVICCPNCGGCYLTAETLYEIERIKMHRKGFVNGQCRTSRL